MDDPRSTSPGSIMPRYSWLLTQKLETASLPSRLKALRKVGVPYPEGFENGPAQKELEQQANKIVLSLKVGMVNTETNREIVALIAYLQRLGMDVKSVPAATPSVTAAK
jgi:cytochrome c oxidase cbb3-type subunit I/II